MARPRTDIEPRILLAARRRFLLEGVDGAALRTIARDARTNVGMIHYYFRTKDDLFLAVVEDVYAGLLHDLETALGPDVAPRERLRRAFLRLGSASEAELEVIRLVIREALVSSERLGRVMARFQRGHIALLLQTVAEAMQQGQIEMTLPPALVMISAMAMGALPQVLSRVAGGTLPFALLPRGDALAEASLDVLFRGVGPRADHS